MIVVDASVLAPAIVDDGPVGDRARARLDGEDLCAPEVMDLEVLSALRGHLRGGHLERGQCEYALADLMEADIERYGHAELLGLAWDHRDNLSAYDAVYVALAAGLGVTLVTADAKLAGAAGLRCEVELLT